MFQIFECWSVICANKVLIVENAELVDNAPHIYGLRIFESRNSFIVVNLPSKYLIDVFETRFEVRDKHKNEVKIEKF